MQRTATYREQSRIFLAQAREELAKGDIPQASEKAWGAAAQMVKAVAQQRGWEHRGHRELHRVIRRLRRETGVRESRPLFSSANDLHSNFYENLYEAVDVQDLLPEVERLIGFLEGQLNPNA